STLHTNRGIGSVTRLRDMGIEPFLLSSSLIGVIAQRLVRNLCPECKEAHPATETECEWLGCDKSQPPQIFKAVGCDKCNHLGYTGRSGVYEVITLDDKLRQMIHDGAGEQEMEKLARQSSKSLKQDGQRLIIEGKTSLEEVLRVSREE
ncbi:MAG: Flp pilus assembly complex ATPase component TadA, partial [Gammaproteobacteria bacterium]|nr:Flp pilus assembly complex ATPase component TadA [Gammaproteobacteria bacterium]